MPRTLSVSRAQVDPDALPAYLAALRELAARLRRQGQSLWLFRHPTSPGVFLEFSESPTAEQHRSRAASDSGAENLESRLQALAQYDAAEPVLWEEVSLEKV